MVTAHGPHTGVVCCEDCVGDRRAVVVCPCSARFNRFFYFHKTDVHWCVPVQLVSQHREDTDGRDGGRRDYDVFTTISIWELLIKSGEHRLKVEGEVVFALHLFERTRGV